MWQYATDLAYAFRELSLIGRSYYAPSFPYIAGEGAGTGMLYTPNKMDLVASRRIASSRLRK